ERGPRPVQLGRVLRHQAHLLRRYSPGMTDAAAITRDAIAAELARAWHGGTAADDTALPVGSAGDAYAIQHRVLALLGEPAGVPRHWKSGAADTTAPLLHAPLPARGVL